MTGRKSEVPPSKRIIVRYIPIVSPVATNPIPIHVVIMSVSKNSFTALYKVAMLRAPEIDKNNRPKRNPNLGT